MTEDDSILKRLSYTFHDEIRDDKGQKISTWDGLKNLSIDTNLHQYILNIITKEVVEDDIIVGAIFVCAMSAYTKIPINIAVAAPSGEGKSYSIGKVLDLFPKNDIISLMGISNKAMLHEEGIDVIVDEAGNRIPLSEILAEMKDEARAIKDRLANETDDRNKRPIERELEDLSDRMEETKKRKRKQITFTGQTYYVQDTPRMEMLDNIMSMLSHDSDMSHYKFTAEKDRKGLGVNTNIIIGSPAFIYSQAIDTSKNPRFEEMSRRFIPINPVMSSKKYYESMKIAGIKRAMPSWYYNETVVSPREKDLARQAIRYLKYKITDVTKHNSLGENDVFIPFRPLILDSFPYSKAIEMTVQNWIIDMICIVTLVNFDRRKKLITPHGITIVSDLEDLGIVIKLLYNSVGGIRPYVIDWYNNVFLKAYEDQHGNIKAGNRNDKVVYENRVAVTVEELFEKTMEVQGKAISHEQLRKKYLWMLENTGFINVFKSMIDQRSNIYEPVLAEIRNTDNSEKTPYIFNRDRLNTRNLTKDQAKECIKYEIQAILNYGFESGKPTNTNKIFDQNNKEISLNDFHDIYFSKMEDYFLLHEEDTDTPTSRSQIRNSFEGNITKELQETTSNDIKNITKVDESLNKYGVFPEKPEVRISASTIEQSSSSNEGNITKPDTATVVEKICPYCNENMKPTGFMDHVIENHAGYSLFPSIDELNLYKTTHGVKRTG